MVQLNLKATLDSSSLDKHINVTLTTNKVLKNMLEVTPAVVKGNPPGSHLHNRHICVILSTDNCIHTLFIAAAKKSFSDHIRIIVHTNFLTQS